MRRGFTLLETLLVVGVVGVISAFSVPLYNQWQIRNDLALAKNQIIQGLERAKLNAQAGKEDNHWSFYVPEGLLFPGTDYAVAKTDPNISDKSELYPMPNTIKTYGLTKVSYDKDGKPDVTGTITLSALNGDVDTIEVQLVVAEGTVQTTTGDLLTICYEGDTLSVTDAVWSSYQSRGATLGTCIASSGSSSSVPSSVASSAASSVSSQASSAASAASSAGGGGNGSSSSASNTCSSKFTVNNNVITTTATTSITFTHLASYLTYGSGGPTIPVHVCYSKNNASSFNSLFGGNGNCSGNGNAYGNAVAVNGTDTKTVNNVPTNSNIAVLVRGKYSVSGWLAFSEAYDSKNHPTRILLLKNGDNPTGNSGFGNQQSLRTLLQARGLLDAQGKVSIGSCELLEVGEIGVSPGSATADYQDSVMRITFN